MVREAEGRKAPSRADRGVRRRSARARARRSPRLAMAGYPQRAAARHGGDAGPAPPPDGEPRADRRSQLRQGLLHRTGDRRARAASRGGEAPHVPRERSRSCATRRRTLRRRPRRPGSRRAPQRRDLARGRLRSSRGGAGGEQGALDRAPRGAGRAGASLPRPALPRGVTSSYYIYYRVPPGNAARARAAIDALQRELSEATGIGGRLLRRQDDETTWMEIYESVSDGPRFEGKLAELVERHGIPGLLAPGSSRKQEVFRGF